MLVVSGQLERQRPEGSMAYAVGDSRIAGRGRDDASEDFNTALFKGRSIYLPILRDALPDELGLFDFPDPQGTVGQRSATNVATQSLHLMNSDLVQEQSRAMAEVLERNFPSVRDQVSNAFLLAYSRPANRQEVERGLQFVREFHPGDPPAPEDDATAESVPRGKGKGKGGKGKRKSQAPATQSAKPDSPMSDHQTKLTAFCQALMMSAEFRMIH